MSKYLDLESAADFAGSFGQAPVGVSHHVLEDERLSLESLAQLAERLPADNVEHNVGNLPEVVADGQAEQGDLTPAEIARTIDTNGMWMVLKWIENDPAYNDLLNATLDEVSTFLPEGQGPMLQREGFIFLSAPGSVTPSHTDPEHNILLQIRGTKGMYVGEFPDVETRQLELEGYASGKHRNVAWKPANEQLFDLHPGDAVYVPPHAPHWVKNGDAASVSLSITFRTPQTDRANRVSLTNSKLRKMGLSPKPPGAGDTRDAIKAAASKVFARL